MVICEIPDVAPPKVTEMTPFTLSMVAADKLPLNLV